MRSSLRSVLASRRRIQSLVAVVILFLVIPTLYTLGDNKSNSSHFRLKWQNPAPPAPTRVVPVPVSIPDHNPDPEPSPDPAALVPLTPDKDRPALPLPSEYNKFPEPALPQSERCNDLFTPRFLDDFRTHSIQYCAAGSTARLHCFQGHTRPNGEVDSICVGQGATLDVARGKFALDCEVRALDENERRSSLIPFDLIRGEWYDSGPRWVFDHYVNVERGASITGTRQSSPKFAVLVKREGADNLWHCMAEIMTMTASFDLLRTTPDPLRGGAPFFADGPDLANTQVIVMDDHPDGNFFKLWSIFGGGPPLRWKDILADTKQARPFAETPHNIIIPLPGAANPIWQGDWKEQNCTHAPLLKVFANRVLQFYGLPTTEEEEIPVAAAVDPPINLTFVDRTGNRRLIDHDALLAAVEAKHPHVRTRSVDFAAISVEEQLRLVRETDVLVGVHGAALTHIMFMRDGRGAVVEILPETNNYLGFRNLAFMKGLAYVTGHAEQVRVGPGEGGEGTKKRANQQRGGGLGLSKRAQWHWDDVRLKEAEFMKLVDDAITAVTELRAGK